MENPVRRSASLLLCSSDWQKMATTNWAASENEWQKRGTPVLNNLHKGRRKKGNLISIQLTRNNISKHEFGSFINT